MKEEILQRSKALCLGTVILGICGSITSVVEADGAWKMAMVAVFVSCVVYLIGCFGRKQRYLVILVWMAGIAIFLKTNWEVLGDGAQNLGNKIIQRINTYYHTNYLLWYQQEEQGKLEVIFLLIFLVLGMLETIFFWWKRKRSGQIAVFIIPVLLLCGGLLLGKACSFWGMFWFLLTIFLWKLLPFQKEKWRNMAVTGMVFLLAAITAVSPLADKVLEQYHGVWYQKQLELEDKMLAFGEKYLNLNHLFAGKVQRNLTLSNQKPQQTGKEVFQITVSEKPTSNIYLKGFIGEVYENGSWSAGSEQEFSDFAQSQGYSLEEYTRTIQNMPGKLIAQRNEPFEISIEPADVMSGYTLMPYYVELEENMQASGDGAIKPLKEKEYTVTQMTKSAGAAKISAEEMEQWKCYQQYVKEHDLRYPKEELNRLAGLIERVENGEKERYLTKNIIINTPFYVQELIVKSLLWEDTSYSLELNEVPEGKEFTEYFLFEQKKGFCVHYATAGTLMFRMLNIPARYVSGYVISPSDFQRDGDGKYTAVVTDENAHAWTEVFVAGAGFSPVEVTPSAADTVQEEETGTVEEHRQHQTEEGQQAEVEQQTESEQQVKENQQQEQKGTLEENSVEEGSGQPSGVQSSVKEQRHSIEIEKVLRIMGILAATISGCGLVVFLVRLRRNHVNERKYKRFHQKNRRKGTLALGREIYRILKEMGYGNHKKMTDSEYGGWLEQNLVLEQETSWKEFVVLQQQAAFSDKEISLEQWQKLLHLYERMKVELVHGKSWRLILYWKYVKILS